MRFVLAALAYIADPAHWSGAMGIGPLDDPSTSCTR